MLSDPVAVLLVAACVFLLIAVVGGGISIREATLPTVPMFGRVVSGVIGSAFLVAAFVVLNSTDPQRNSGADSAESLASEVDDNADIDDASGPVADNPGPTQGNAQNDGNREPDEPVASTTTVTEGQVVDFDNRLRLEVTDGSLSPLGMHHADIAIIDREGEAAAVRRRAIAGNDYQILNYTIVILDILEADEPVAGDTTATVEVQFGIQH